MESDSNLTNLVTRLTDTKKVVQLKALIGEIILLLTVLFLVIPIIEKVITIIILEVFGLALSHYLYLNTLKRIWSSYTPWWYHLVLLRSLKTSC
jgi:hypothetical protein